MDNQLPANRTVFYYDLRDPEDFKFKNKMRVCAFGIITAFWFFDFFFVAGFVLSNSPGFVSVMAVILGLVYTIYGKIKQCKKIDKIRTEGRIDKSYFVSMYTGLTAITNAVFAKTKQELGEPGYQTFGQVSGLIVGLLQILTITILFVVAFYLLCFCLNNCQQRAEYAPKIIRQIQQYEIRQQNRRLAKSCKSCLKLLFFIGVPILGWIGFVYHIVFAFVMTIVSHQYSEFFVVIAPVLDVLFYILELQVYLCKSRVRAMITYSDDKEFRNKEGNKQYFPNWYDILQKVQQAFHYLLIVLICVALIIFLIDFPKTPPFILFFILTCFIIQYPLVRMAMLTHYQRQAKFKSTAPFIFHSMTGCFFIVIVFHFIQFGSGWGLLFWLGFGVLGNYILARAVIIRVHTTGNTKRYYLLGDDLYEVIAFWFFKILNYASYFFDVFLYWNQGSRVGHIILDIVIFYDLADFIVTIIIYAIINRKYFKLLGYKEPQKGVLPIQNENQIDNYQDYEVREQVEIY